MLIHTGNRIEFRSLTVTDCNRTSLVQQQSVDVTGRLHSLTGFGNHVGTQSTVHSGNTDGRKQTADGRRNQANEQRTESCNGNHRIGIVGKRFQGNADNQEYQSEHGQQYRQSDFIRSLLAACTFYQGNHLVQEALARLTGHNDLDMVGKYLRTTGNGTLVAACLTDYRSRFTGNGTLIDRSQTFDDFTVGRNHVASLAFKHITFLQL